MSELQAQRFSLHVEGTLSSDFSAVPLCNTTGKLFIENGFKGGESKFIEVILLLSETEKGLLFAAFFSQTAFASSKIPI